jgi:hypothetical protein
MRDGILINADDFGISNSVNEGIVYCFEKKLIDRTTIIVNMPATEKAVKLSKKYKFDDKVGLHLNIVEGVPLTNDIRNTILCNKDGTFDGNALKITKNRLWLDKKTTKAVIEEVEAQIDKFFSFGYSLKHLDSHQHSHNDISILKCIEPYIKENFQSVRLAKNIPNKDINGIKKIYKSYINKKILKYNKNKYYRKFGYMCDTDCIDFRYLNFQELEIEVHPAIVNGELIDMIEDYNIEHWLHKKDL